MDENSKKRKQNEYWKKWYEKHRQEHIDKQKEYYEEKRESILEYQREYQKKNRERRTEYKRRYRARKKAEEEGEKPLCDVFGDESQELESKIVE